MPPERMADLATAWAVPQREFAQALHAVIDGPAAIGAPTSRRSPASSTRCAGAPPPQDRGEGARARASGSRTPEDGG
jgi:hypothetical protein